MDRLTPGEELVQLRSGPWRLLVPMRHVARVHTAALPAPVPAAGAAAHPVLSLGGELVPVLFSSALFGAAEAVLSPADKLVELAAGGHRALLWVSAVEDLVPHQPVGADRTPAAGGLVAGFSESEGVVPVLDVPGALAAAASCT